MQWYTFCISLSVNKISLLKIVVSFSAFIKLVSILFSVINSVINSVNQEINTCSYIADNHS